MRFALLCAAALAAAPAMAQDLVARQGNDTVRLATRPAPACRCWPACSPEIQSEFKAALAVVEGRTFEACWRPAGNVAHLLYEDGDQGHRADGRPQARI